MSLAEIQLKYARGAVLDLLRDGTKANDLTLTTAVQTTRALQVTRDQIRTSIDWLERQGYITVDRISDFRVAQIRTAGIDYLEGRTSDDGIQRVLS